MRWRYAETFPGVREQIIAPQRAFRNMQVKDDYVLATVYEKPTAVGMTDREACVSVTV